MRTRARYHDAFHASPPSSMQCRVSPGLMSLVLVLTLTRDLPSGIAFQIGGRPFPTKISRTAQDSFLREQIWNGRAGYAYISRTTTGVFQTKEDNDDKENGDSDKSTSVPFFARMANRARGSFGGRKDDTTGEADGGVAVAEKPKSEAKPEETTTKTLTKEEDKSKQDLMAHAQSLKAQAERTRLEAEKMEAVLTLEKIASLEKKLESPSLKKHPEQEIDVRNQIELLKTKLRGPTDASTIAPASTSTVQEARTVPSSLPSPKTEAVPTKEEHPSRPAKMGKKENKEEESTGILSSMENPPPKASMSDITKSIYDSIPPMPEDELQTQLEAFLKTPKVLRELTARAAGFEDDSNATAVVEQMYKDEQYSIKKKEMKERGEIPPIDDDSRAKALTGYKKLPEPIQDLVARSVGMDSGRNASAVIEKLEAEGRLFAEEGVEGFEVDSDIMEIFTDAEFAEKAGYVSAMLPEVTRKDGQTPTDEDIDVFFTQVLGKDTFNPVTRPERVPGGVLIRGENRMKDYDAEELVKALEKKMASTSVSNKLQFYYIRDPTPVTEEQFENEEYELPLLLITGADLSPTTNPFVKALISLLGLIGVVAFALGSFSFNSGIVDRLSAAAASGDSDLAWLKDLATPLVMALLGTQLAHEAGHQFVALKDKIKTGPPTLIPSLQIGLTGAITPIKTPPKNLKSMFDFAIMGPLVGMTVSLLLLYSGLENTVFMDPAAQAQLPSLPVQLLRCSSLAGGMIEWLLGDGVLLSPDPVTSMVGLRPFAIAGFAGVITNALSLLPIGNTDGGRIAQAMFGRSFSRIVQGFTLFGLVVLGLFGFDESNLLLTYALFAAIWQREPEIPCKNEVDDLDTPRVLVAIGTAMLVALALIPITS